MKTRICVLFAGNAGAGKDTAADMLAAECGGRGLSVLRMAFADPIKELAVPLLGIPKEVSYGTQQDKLDYKVYGQCARHWLQWIGTEMGRNQIHKDIWVHRFAEKAISSDADVVIGSDCRFRNEMALMRTILEGGKGSVSARMLLGDGDRYDGMSATLSLTILKIVNPRVPVNLAHQSESEVYNIPDDEFDLVIHNTKELKDLECHIATLADKILPTVS